MNIFANERASRWCLKLQGGAVFINNIQGINKQGFQ